MEKGRKDKSASLPDEAAIYLVDCFIRDEVQYNERVIGGSKKGKTPRQRCGDRWAEELSALGCDRTGQQLLDRLKGDIIKVRGLLSEERVERNKTGGGKAKASEKLDAARRKLYEHFSGSHILNGISCGFESKPTISPTPQISHLMENEQMFDHDDKIDSLFSRSSVDHESDNEKDVPVPIEQSNASTKNSFAEFAKSRKRKQETSEVTDLRVKLLKAELELTEKKSRNMDLENAQVIEKLEILKIKRETAEIEKRIAEAEAEKLGLFNRAPSYLNL
ncbi:unnamed protein product [Caenorhabditis brenneri]